MAALDNLERLRQNLESNIAQLKKSLQYWQTWEYEYEGFKEELERPEEEPSAEEMLHIGTDLEGDIVDEKEVQNLLNYGKTPSRTRAQVITQIRGRIDTGQKNAQTVRKQLGMAEEKLEKVLVVAEPMQPTDEDGAQLMDIVEELDEDGNVVSSKLVDQREEGNALNDILNGLDGKEKGKAKAAEPAASKATAPKPPTKTAPKPQPKSAPKRPPQGDDWGKKDEAKQEELIDYLERQSPPDNVDTKNRMLILDENDKIVGSEPIQSIAPAEESEDDDEEASIAQLREARMNAQDIAPIVASFDIDEASSDEDMDSDVDSEYEYGMNDTGAELTDDYKKEMEELMAKHAVAMENAGPNYNPEVMQKLENAHRDSGMVVSKSSNGQANGEAKNQEAPVESAMKEEGKPKKKGVRFASELDTDDGTKPAPTTNSNAEPEEVPEPQAEVNPVSEDVLERSSKTLSAADAEPPRKVSKFKANMNTKANRGTAMPPAADDSPITIKHEAPPIVHVRDDISLPERPKKMSRFKASKMGN